MKALLIGDIVGRPGREILKEYLPELKDRYQIDLTIVNGENSASGSGITRKTADEIFNSGVDVITTGNHVWDKQEIFDWIEKEANLVRPANYPERTPGKGFVISKFNNCKVAIINLCGRVFMPPLDCAFRAFDNIYKRVSLETKNIIVDFHAEATSEKCALGYYLDGRVTCVFGTHTHVQTSDARILPKGTAFVSDIGMTGAYDSVIGMDKEHAISSFVNHYPIRFEVAYGKAQLNGAVLDFDTNSGKAKSLETIQIFE